MKSLIFTILTVVSLGAQAVEHTNASAPAAVATEERQSDLKPESQRRSSVGGNDLESDLQRRIARLRRQQEAGREITTASSSVLGTSRSHSYKNYAAENKYHATKRRPDHGLSSRIMTEDDLEADLQQRLARLRKAAAK